MKLKDYRVMIAVIKSDAGTYYVKFYGPKRTMAAHEKAFGSMITGLK